MMTGSKVVKLEQTVKELSQLPTSQNGSHFVTSGSALSELSIIEERQVSIRLKK
jgi:hypothetical protein